MKLLTKAIAKQLPPLYSQEKLGTKATAFLKLFSPDSNWTWYVTEMDPETGDCFGLVQGHETELGYFNLNELERVRGPLGLSIERDRWFEPTPLTEFL